jgi:hypothetical protein
MSEDKNVSLLNCDFTKKKVRLTSPHSLLALHYIGVMEEDLIYQTQDEYIKKNIDCQYLEKELQQERYEHFEKNRNELIEEAKKQRELLINMEEKSKNNNNNNSSSDINNKSHSRGFKKNTSCGAFDSYGESSTAIKLEREKLKKLKEKQENNVRLQIDYECAREENRRKNMEKMRKKEEKEKKRRMEKEKEIMEKMRMEREKEIEKRRKEEEHMKEYEKKRKEEEYKEKRK